MRDPDAKEAWRASALESFGAGAHTIMDGASPAHKGFQIFDNGKYFNPNVGVAGDAIWWTYDTLKHAENEQRPPTDEEMKAMVEVLRYRFRMVFGDEEYYKAIGETAPAQAPASPPK